MGGTTKYAKNSKMGTQIVFKEERYKIIGACLEVYKDKAENSDKRTNRIPFALKKALLK